MGTSNKFNFDVVLSNFKRDELALAKRVAMTMKNYYIDSFKKQSWNGKKWKQVKRRIPGTAEYKYPKKRGKSRRVKPILTLTGTLRRGVNNSIKKVTPKMVQLEVTLPYAKIQNEGGTTKNGAKIVARPYMGWDKILVLKVKKVITDAVDNNFKTK